MRLPSGDGKPSQRRTDPSRLSCVAAPMPLAGTCQNSTSSLSSESVRIDLPSGMNRALRWRASLLRVASTSRPCSAGATNTWPRAVMATRSPDGEMWAEVIQSTAFFTHRSRNWSKSDMRVIGTALSEPDAMSKTRMSAPC